ncbi:MAG: phosphatidylcholine/phosphatidylserine synthase [Lactobacillales bacterium]|jgi:CDP-diacylglycerol--serine O-phosphatidyltransferase|nr:phosphatidylcholine/phosphatidylserine synthase [Lactobacillales bacterium]
MTRNKMNFKPAIPNGITMLALAFGVSALNMAFWGQWKMAFLFIVLSAVFDFFDGKFARMLGVSSKFGVELDSLSDLVSFGIAPGFIMYLWTMDSMARIEVLTNLAKRGDAVGMNWIFVVFLAMCCAARLARFNSTTDDTKPDYWKHFFMGVPAPAGGFLALYPLILWFATNGHVDFFRSPVFSAVFIAFSGVMMVSRIPTLALKNIRLKNSYRTLALFLFFIFIAGLVTKPWITLAILGGAYIVSIPAGGLYFLKLKNKTPPKKRKKA